MSQIEGKTILITGAASGIGRLMALNMARLGGRIVAWDINAANLDKLAGELKLASSRPHATYVCDVSNRAQVYEMAAKVKAEVGPVDILINNAGVVSGRPFLEVPDERIEATMKVNTMALFWTAKAFLPDMIQRNSGHLVTIASAAGLIGVTGLADYSASKFAAVGFDESMRMELRKTPGVKTTVVCPFFIDTGMFEGVTTRFPWLLPILKEEEVARRIVEAVQKDRRRLVLPPVVNVLAPARLLPVRAFDAIADFLGVNASMDSFRGRTEQAAKPREVAS
jgi:all-trans-retinol dehydrogenase (NAD+)